MFLPCINELMEKTLPAEKQKDILEIITEENLEVLDRIGNPGVYMDFIREQYLK